MLSRQHSRRWHRRNTDIVAVCNDSVGSSKLEGFRERWPERLINVGIAEQNLVGVAAGLANGGKLPFVCAAACFLTGRALEQIKADIAYSNANVKLCGISSGMAYGELGPTHHSTEDFAWIRAIPNIAVVAPADRIETVAATEWAASYDGPVFLRLSRVGVPDLLPEGHRFELGKANMLRDGTDLTIIANGTLTHRAVHAAEDLATRGIEARVLNMATVRPIDENAIVEAACGTGAIVTCEEHTIYGWPRQRGCRSNRRKCASSSETSWCARNLRTDRCSQFPVGRIWDVTRRYRGKCD